MPTGARSNAVHSRCARTPQRPAPPQWPAPSPAEQQREAAGRSAAACPAPPLPSPGRLSCDRPSRLSYHLVAL
jgi:hypothetical protein